jgi:hypothetical protein
MIIGFCGPAGSGKSTAALHLVQRHGYHRVRFAGPLKAMMRALGCTEDEVDGALKETPCELLGGRTPRQAMQWLGTEWGRQMITPDLWLRAWAAEARLHRRVVCDDVRFPNEEAEIRARGGIIVRVECPWAASPGSGHASEQQPIRADITLRNDVRGDVAPFRLQLDRLMIGAEVGWAV